MNTTNGFCECGCGERAPISAYTRRGYRKGEPQRFVRGHDLRANPLRLVGAEIAGWAGDQVGYSALHRWVRYWKIKTGVCVRCGTDDKRTEWANISGEYLRDLDDYEELCCSCHQKQDIARRVAA